MAGRGIDFQKYFVSGRMKAVAMSVAMRCKPIHFVLLTDTSFLHLNSTWQFSVAKITNLNQNLKTKSVSVYGIHIDVY